MRIIQAKGAIIFLFLLQAPFGQYGPVAAFELYLYTAVDSRPGPEGSRTSKLSALRPSGHGRYRFATASAKRVPSYSSQYLGISEIAQMGVFAEGNFFFPASALWPVWPGQSTVSVGRKLYRSI